MTTVLVVLLILFVIAFIAARTPQGAPYSWTYDVVGGLLIIALTCIALGWVRA